VDGDGEQGDGQHDAENKTTDLPVSRTRHAVQATQNAYRECKDAARRFGRGSIGWVRREWDRWLALDLDKQLSVVLTVLILAAATAAASYTKRQWQVASAQLESSSRAWVFVADFKTVPEDQTDPAAENFVSRLTIKNGGTAPAVRIVGALSPADKLAISPSTDVGDLTWVPGEDASRTVAALAPGESQTIKFDSFPKSFRQGSKPQLIGAILYFDQWRRQRMTPICIYLNMPSGMPPGQPYKGQFAACRDHNQMR